MDRKLLRGPMLLATSVETGGQLATAISCSIGSGASAWAATSLLIKSQYERSLLISMSSYDVMSRVHYITYCSTSCRGVQFKRWISGWIIILRSSSTLQLTALFSHFTLLYWLRLGGGALIFTVPWAEGLFGIIPNTLHNAKSFGFPFTE